MALWYFLPGASESGPDIVAWNLHAALCRIAADAGLDLFTVCERESDSKLLPNEARFLPWKQALLTLGEARPTVHFPKSPLANLGRRRALRRRALRLGLCIVSNVHGDPMTEIRFAIADADMRAIARLAPSVVQWRSLLTANSALVVNSSLMRGLLRPFLESSAVETHTIPNGLDPWWLTSDERPRSEPRISTHGRIASEKGIRELALAVHQIQDELGGVRVTVFGAGPLRSRMERWAGRHNLKSLEFAGHLPWGALRERLASSVGCVYPSTFDMFSLAALEALACANGPVCISQVAGIWEHLGTSALPRHSFPPTVDGIAEVLIRQLDKASGWSAAALQRSLARGLVWENVAPMYLKLYRSLGA